MLTVQRKVESETLKALFLERDYTNGYLRAEAMDPFVKELGIKRFEIHHEVSTPLESSVLFVYEPTQTTVVMHPGDYLVFKEGDYLNVMTEDCFDAQYVVLPKKEPHKKGGLLGGRSII